MQVSCTYGPSMNPALAVNIHVARSLLNMTYTQGYTPPPYVLANPNAYIPLTTQFTYVYGAGLNRVLSFPIKNTDTIEGAHPMSSCYPRYPLKATHAALYALLHILGSSRKVCHMGYLHPNSNDWQVNSLSCTSLRSRASTLTSSAHAVLRALPDMAGA